MAEPTQREDDDPEAHAYKRRKLVVSPDGPPVVVNGTLAKVRIVSIALKEIANAGVATVVFIAGFLVVISWASGWIPFPLAAYVTKYVESHERMAQSLEGVKQSLNRRQIEWDQERRAFRELLLVICTNTSGARQHLEERVKCYPRPD
jgi:hypothetical protein